MPLRISIAQLLACDKRFCLCESYLLAISFAVQISKPLSCDNGLLVDRAHYGSKIG